MWIPKGAALIRGRRLFEARYLLEEIQYLFFTAMKIHSMTWIVKKKNNFIFVYQLHKLVRCVSSLPSGIEQLHRHHYLMCTKVLLVQCLYETVRSSFLFANSPCTFTSFCAIIQFRITEKHYWNSLLLSNIENIRFMINLCLF